MYLFFSGTWSTFLHPARRFQWSSSVSVHLLKSIEAPWIFWFWDVKNHTHLLFTESVWFWTVMTWKLLLRRQSCDWAWWADVISCLLWCHLIWRCMLTYLRCLNDFISIKWNAQCLCRVYVYITESAACDGLCFVSLNNVISVTFAFLKVVN